MMRLIFCACLLSALALSHDLHAAVVASDNAGNYSGGWGPGDNLGTGWGGGWTFLNQNNVVLTATNGNRGWFTGSSVANNPGGVDSNGDNDINSAAGNRAWGVYSNSTDQVYAVRPLNGALSVGQSIVWDMDNGLIATGQVVGMRFLSNAADINTRVFEARFVGDDTTYSLVGSPNQSTTTGYSREGLHLEYTLTGANTYSLKIVRLENNETKFYTGTNVSAANIVALAFKNQFAGSGAPSDGFFNNIAVGIIPEASAVWMGGIVAAACAVAGLESRRKKARLARAVAVAVA